MIKKSILVLALMAVASAAAMAAEYYWDVASGNWSLGSNWDPTGPPDTIAVVYVDNDGTVTIDMDVTNADVQRISLYDGIINQSANSMQTNDLSLGLDYEIGDCGSGTGIYNLSGGTLDLVTSLQIGIKTDTVAAGKGYFNMTGGTFDVSVVYVGHSAGSYGEFNISDGTLNVSGIFIVGRNTAMGNGIFRQTGGEVNADGDLLISHYFQTAMTLDSGYGIYLMEGGDLNVAGDIHVGDVSGTNAGIMKLKAGHVVTNNFYITAAGSYLYDACANHVSHVTLEVFGEFINSSTDNANFNITHTTLIMAGGGVGWDDVNQVWDMTSIDMGGVENKGNDKKGLVWNFAIGDLVFKGGTANSLYYQLDSDIYCYGLRVESGVAINLNGFDIYYLPVGAVSYHGSRPTTGGIDPGAWIVDPTETGAGIYQMSTDLVPEPGTIVLIATGVLGLAAVLRRKYC